MDIWTIIADLGLPIAAAVACGVFIMIVINYILSSIVSSISFIETVTEQLDILKIDSEVSEQLGLPVDTDRIARADGKEDARKD
jgi:hypothetical protein